MRNHILPLLILLLLVIQGCKKDHNQEGSNTIDSSVQFTADTFNDLYLWYQSMPTVELQTVSTPDDYINKVRYAKDNWSFAMSYSALNELLESGESSGWGAGFAFDNQDLLRIIYVYNNSPMGKAGVKRGWQIKAINGKTVASISDDEVNAAINNNPSNSFQFIKNDGSETTLNLTKGGITINTVLYSAVYKEGDHNIGYLVFSDFLNSSVNELNVAFNDFNNQGVTDLILDLRYNGGGTLDSADSLVALLAGKPFKDNIYNTLTYNNKHVRYGYQSVIGLKDNSIQLDHLVVITTSSTASASELVISGLKPYLNLTLIGSTTHGKPVGMDIKGNTNLDLAVAPISFRNTNSEGYTDYFDGIPVDYNVADNATQDWGNRADGCLRAALNYIGSGTIGLTTTKSAIIPSRLIYDGTKFPIENLYHLEKPQ